MGTLRQDNGNPRLSRFPVAAAILSVLALVAVPSGRLDAQDDLIDSPLPSTGVVDPGDGRGPSGEDDGGDAVAAPRMDDATGPETGPSRSATPQGAACMMAVPSECLDAGLEAEDCMDFFRRRVRQTDAILRRVLDSCPSPAPDPDRAPAVATGAQLQRFGAEVRSLRADLDRMRSENLALAAERDRLAGTVATQRARILELETAGQGSTDDPGHAGTRRTQADPGGLGGEEVGGAAIAGLGARLMDESALPETYLDVADVCAAPPPGEADVAAAIDAAPEIFADLSDIQRARVVQSLVSGRGVRTGVIGTWTSPVRRSHREAREAAAAHLCREVPYGCMEVRDRARLCG